MPARLLGSRARLSLTATPDGPRPRPIPSATSFSVRNTPASAYLWVWPCVSPENCARSCDVRLTPQTLTRRASGFVLGLLGARVPVPNLIHLFVGCVFHGICDH